MNSFHHLLMKSHVKLHKAVMTKAAGYALTAGQPKILEYLYEVKRADQKTIAGHCEIEAATVGSILYRMEKSGLVQRERQEGDRRAVIVSLTAAGEVAAEETQRLFNEAEEQALKGISEEDRQKLCETLQKVYDNLKSSEDIQ